MNETMKIVIVTAVWKRPEIFELFAQGVDNLKGFMKDIEIQVVIAGSEGEESEKMVRSKGYAYCEVANAPLGKKMNTALRAARELKPDYCLFMGSDDILSPGVLQMYLQDPELKDYYGVTDFYFYDALTTQTLYWGGYDKEANRGHACGAGRMLSSRLLDKMNWQCWDDDIDRKLDTSMQKRLQIGGYTVKTFSLKEEGVMAVDIKTLINRTPFAHWDNTEVVDSNLVLKSFPYIKDLKRMKITANIATYQPRVARLHEVIDSLIDQVDVIRISINEIPFGDVEHLLEISDKVLIHSDPMAGDRADNAKFAYLDLIEEPEYYFSCDDDIIYPPDYVSKTIRFIEDYKMIVSYHGRKLLAKDVLYYERHKFYHCLNEVHTSKKIDVAGTGVTAFRTDYFHPKGLANDVLHRMSDLLFSLEAAKQGKKIGAFEHKAGWIKAIDYAESIFNTEQIAGQSRQIELANQIYDLNYGD